MNFDVTALGSDTQLVAPILVLLFSGLVLMLLDAFRQYKALPWVASVGVVIAAAVSFQQIPLGNLTAFSGMMKVGGIAAMVQVFLAVTALGTLFFIQDYLARKELPLYDVYALIIFALIGMILFANANDLIMTFIGLETMSICLYIFAAFFKRDVKSNESGLKYFLLGAFASAFLLFGISLIYGISGTTNFQRLSESIYLFQENELLFLTGATLVLVGYLFKVAAFPFHNWTPDVYIGTPTPLSGFMATGGKMAAFVALGHFLLEVNLIRYDNGALIQYDKMVTLLAIIAVITMIYGNIVAARQENIKRMLAYSSIAHAGYVLLGLCAGETGFIAAIFYMFIYSLMNIGAFGVVGMAEKSFDDTRIESWRGMGLKHPVLAGVFSVFLFSLAGIPPLAGFMSKYYIFISALRAELVFLAVIGILSSVIGAYYYIRLIVVMFSEGKSASSLSPSTARLPVIGAAVLVLLILLLGIFPSLILEPINQAVSGVTELSVIP
ncbi:MAG: NADH-quinone oxidoreductase subunit N [Bacteroidota bacterium]